MTTPGENENCVAEPLLKRLCGLSKYYRDNFIPAYADLIVVVNAKPIEILLEIENVLSHFIQILNPEIDHDQKNENIDKARGHVERATLDCLKIVWTEKSKLLSRINSDELARRYCINMPEQDFVRNYEEYKELLAKARLIEMNSVGTSHEETIEAYKRAIELAKNLSSHIDYNKLNSFNAFRKIINAKTSLVSFLLGVSSSLVACYIWGVNIHNSINYIRGLLGV
jgi:hypothetical protein